MALGRGNSWPRVLILVALGIVAWLIVSWISSSRSNEDSLVADAANERLTSELANNNVFDIEVEDIEDTGQYDADEDYLDLEDDADDEEVMTSEDTTSSPLQTQSVEEEGIEQDEIEDEIEQVEKGEKEVDMPESEVVEEDIPMKVKTTTGIPSTTESLEGESAVMRNIPLHYVPPPASGVEGQGKRIQVDRKLLQGMGIPLRKFTVLDNRSVLDFVFATGSPSNWFIDSKDTVAGIQKFFPGYKVVYYDLGLTEDQRQQVKTWCNVELRDLDYDKYPEHVKEYRIMAYKPLVVNELLLTHKAVMWMDPHFRAFKGNWTHVFDTILKNGGIYLFKYTGIPGYLSTHPKVYKYFPANIERYKVVGDYWAGGMLLYGTEPIYWNILYWWTLCALDVNCIAPTDEYFCKKWKNWSKFVDREEPENTRWAKCHRFGQSIISLLTNNYFGYKGNQFTHYGPDPVASVIRNATWLHDLKYCKP